ncbi:MAG: TA system VapC family ribonuclease toxin [Candidatus Dormibacteria bacterium]
MTHLLDVNVLISLAWPNHVHHSAAHAWFGTAGAWATTPLTEVGFTRVSSGPAVGHPVKPADALALLDELRDLPGHVFLADDVAGVVGHWLEAPPVATRHQVADAHLLALAMRHDARLATFDRGLAAAAMASARARDHVLLIPS